MMTPADLADFATGFCLTERLADTPADILDAIAVRLDETMAVIEEERA